MAELETRLQGAVHEKEGLTGLLLAAEEKFALQMVGRQIQDIKYEASTLRTRLKAFEPQSPCSMQGWAPTAAMYNHLRQQIRKSTEATVRMRKSQSSPAATVKKAECRIQSSVRDIIVGGTATSEPMLPVTSDDEQTEAVVTYSSWSSGVAPDRIPLAAQEHMRMRMEGLPPMMMSAKCPVKRGVFVNANGNAIDTTEQAQWPLPDDYEMAAPPSVVWELSPKTLTVRISPKIEPAGGDQMSPEIRTCKLECIPEQGRPEAADTPELPRTNSVCGPTSPLTAYMYPILDLLGSDTDDSVRSTTPSPLPRRDRTGSCQRSHTDNTAATAEVEALSAHAEPEPDTLSACVADDTTTPGVLEKSERRRHYPTRHSRIPPPRVFSC